MQMFCMSEAVNVVNEQKKWWLVGEIRDPERMLPCDGDLQGKVLTLKLGEEVSGYWNV